MLRISCIMRSSAEPAQSLKGELHAFETMLWTDRCKGQHEQLQIVMMGVVETLKGIGSAESRSV
jgi:hypothetical protein